MTPPNLRDALNKVVQSNVFGRSKRHADLLRFLAERGEAVKETVVGCDFFGRAPDYDPKADPVVRVEMRRLRERLAEYYREEGSGDVWRAEIAKGGYRVTLSGPVRVETAARTHRFGWAAMAAGLAVTAILSVAAWKWRPEPEARIGSVAVLPLSGESGSAESPALGGAITNALARIGGLRVVAPPAAARAQAKGAGDPAEIGRLLDVEGVLSGEWISGGPRARLQLRISRASDRRVIWTRTFERDVVDRFALEDEIAANVAAAIHRDLVGKRHETRPGDRAAVLAFDRGNRLMARRSAPAIREAIREFQSAVEIDAGYADGWAALANALATAPDYYHPDKGWAKAAREAAQRALSIDPRNVEAQAALGWIEFEDDVYLNRARTLLERAVELDPNHVPSRRRLGLILTFLEQFEEAEQHLRTALRLDPLSEIARVNLAELYFYMGDFRREETELRAVLAANPHFAVARIMLARALFEQGRCPEALDEATTLSTNPDAEGWRLSTASIQARCGATEIARALWRSGDAATREELALALGETLAMRAWIGRMAAQRPATVLVHSMSPDRKYLDKDPATAAIVQGLEARMRRPH